MTPDYQHLVKLIREWGRALGFQQVGITGIDLAEDEQHLHAWLAAGRHGEMDYMSRHGSKRSRPAELLPGTIRIISVRMDYRPPAARATEEILNDSSLAFVSRYATGRDYHKVLRSRLRRLAARIREHCGDFGQRAFVDSAPVLEKALARNSGLGWIGKHSNLIHPSAGSWFFLGELYTDLPLPVDTPFNKNHCGTCSACMDICPTRAIVAPYEVDARRCISYLTIELRGSIPQALRKPMGNRIYGCDDCQLVCPWNRFARDSTEDDFKVRHGLDSVGLTELFKWSKEEFLRKSEGSAIRRIGYQCWLRNIAVALGNTAASPEVISALLARKEDTSALVREHVAWALAQHDERL